MDYPAQPQQQPARSIKATLLERMGFFFENLVSPEPQPQHLAVRSIRELLLAPDMDAVLATIDLIIERGAIQIFAGILRNSDPTLVQDTLWCLTNICAGTTEQTRAVVESEALPRIIELLPSPDKPVARQVLSSS
eukprot:m.5669 g.5669  ORF g.5669 m.5669 type:complete len:135 (-) comp6830_c0_seq1:85-489(-)